MLVDMREAAEGITTFARGRTLDEYQSDTQLRWAIERGFEIIGEALSQLNRTDPALAGKIREHRKIISFRNILIHGYSKINHMRTWDIVQNDVPALLGELEQMLI